MCTTEHIQHTLSKIKSEKLLNDLFQPTVTSVSNTNTSFELIYSNKAFSESFRFYPDQSMLSCVPSLTQF